MPGVIVVLSALDTELRALEDRLESAEPVELGPVAGKFGGIHGRDVVVLRTGLGKVATGLAVGLVWDRFRPGAFLFSGVAGGLAPELSIGDVVIGERSIQHDAGVIEPCGLVRYQPGHVPFVNPTDEYGYSPSHALLDRVHQAVDGLTLSPVLDRTPTITFGTVLTGDQYLRDENTRRELHHRFGAAAIEMEGAAMAQAATMFGADHLVVRALSDLAGAESIDDFGRYVSEVSANTAMVVSRIISVI